LPTTPVGRYTKGRSCGGLYRDIAYRRDLLALGRPARSIAPKLTTTSSPSRVRPSPDVRDQYSPMWQRRIAPCHNTGCACLTGARTVAKGARRAALSRWRRCGSWRCVAARARCPRPQGRYPGGCRRACATSSPPGPGQVRRRALRTSALRVIRLTRSHADRSSRKQRHGFRLDRARQVRRQLAGDSPCWHAPRSQRADTEQVELRRCLPKSY
jgi:hypothetical protein